MNILTRTQCKFFYVDGIHPELLICFARCIWVFYHNVRITRQCSCQFMLQDRSKKSSCIWSIIFNRDEYSTKALMMQPGCFDLHRYTSIHCIVQYPVTVHVSTAVWAVFNMIKGEYGFDKEMCKFSISILQWTFRTQCPALCITTGEPALFSTPKGIWISLAYHHISDGLHTIQNAGKKLQRIFLPQDVRRGAPG